MDEIPLNDTEQGLRRWEYYEILGVDKEVTLEELRKKRKRLALRYHPDKNQGDDTTQEKMQQVNRAFDVLSDPMKKKLYDRYGPEAVVLYENKTITENMWRFIFILVNQRFTAFVGCSCFLLFSVILLAPLFIGLKLDETITWSWFLILSPLFVLEILVFLFTLSMVILDAYFRDIEESSGESENNFLEEDKKQKLSPTQVIKGLLVLLVVGLVIGFTVLLCFQLDEIVDWNWWIIFSPLLAAEVLFILLQLPAHSYSNYSMRQMTSDDPFPQFYCKLHYPGYLLRNLYVELIIFCFTILVAMNLEYSPSAEDIFGGAGVSGYVSWWYITIPVWVLLGLCLLLSIIENCCERKIKRNNYVPLEDQNEEEQSSFLANCAYVCCSCICVSVVFVFFILLSGWSQADFGFSALAMLSPLLVVASLLFCVCVCIMFPIYAYCVHSYSKPDQFDISSSTQHKEEEK